MANKHDLFKVLTILCLLVLFIVLFSSCGAPKRAVFTHGVASGDPDQTSVLLWTRLVSEDSTSATLSWQVASDSLFTNIVQQGQAEAAPENDFIIKVIADQLDAGTTYFYRFSHAGTYSVTGRTKTLPTNTENIRIGVVNCAKYTGGYYHAYDALSKLEVDVVIHVGDYIYENGPSTPKSSYWDSYLATGRQHDPMYECHSLSDYRTRYAQYRGDTVLQNLHARFPMIAVWDDHEIAMKELDPAKAAEAGFTGTWEERFNNSIKAYHEWVPLRPEPLDDIYRSFQFGDLVNLMMLDARVCCKSEVTKTQESLEDSSRHIIGNEQLAWIQEEVTTHNASWNVFGNQLLISLKGNGWERWQGFPRDRSRFLDFVEAQPKRNFVFTTGNAHNPHHYIVMNEDKSDTLLHELLPGAISSGNNSEKARYDSAIIAKEDKRLREEENVLWFHQDAHAFILLDITREQLKADWYFVSSIRKKDYTVSIPYSITLKPTDNPNRNQ